MSKEAKKKFPPLAAIALVAAIVLAALLAAPFIIDVDRFRPELQSRLSAALGREVETGKLRLSLLSGSIGVDAVSVGDDPAYGSEPFLQAASLGVGVELKPLLLSRQVLITEIILDNPVVNLVRGPDGRWNVSTLGAGGAGGRGGAPSAGRAGADVLIQKLRIAGGSIRIRRSGSDGRVSGLDGVNVTAADLSFARSFPFAMTAALPGGGSLKLEGEAGPIGRDGIAATPLRAEFDIRGLDWARSGLGSGDAGMGGVIDAGGALESDGRRVRFRGEARAERLQVVRGGSPAGQEVLLDFAATYDTAGHRGALENTRLSCGGAVADLSGDFGHPPEGFTVNLRLRGTDMPVDDIRSLLPAFGVVLPEGASLEGGVIGADATAVGPLQSVRMDATAEISGTRLTGFDLAGKMAVLAAVSGIRPGTDTDIEIMTARVQMRPEGTRVRDIRLVAPAIGTLTGAGAVGPDRSLDFGMVAEVKVSGGLGDALSQLVGRGGAPGFLEIPFLVQGTASDPKFLPDAGKAIGGRLGSPPTPPGEGEGGTRGAERAVGDALRKLLGN